MTVELLRDAIEQRRGLVVVTGSSGTGKTRLCRTLKAKVGSSTFAALIAPPVHSAEHLLETILDGFGVGSPRRAPVTSDANRLPGDDRPGSDPRQALSEALHRFLFGLVPVDADAALIVDDAHELPQAAFEQILELARLEADGRPLLQIILVGHSALLTALAAPELAELEARVSVRYELESARRAAASEFRAPLVVAGFVALAASVLAVGVSTIVYQRLGF